MYSVSALFDVCFPFLLWLETNHIEDTRLNFQVQQYSILPFWGNVEMVKFNLIECSTNTVEKVV